MKSFFVSSVVSEIWCMFIWTMPANTCTKLAKIRLKIIHTLREWIWSWSYLPMIILKWGTGRYLMNWIQVVSFKLKDISLLFSIAKAKKLSSFFTSLSPKHESMKANLNQKAMKLGPNDNWGTGRYLLIEFKLFFFKLKEIWLFSNAKATKTGLFFLVSMKVNLSQKAMKLGPNDNWGTGRYLMNWIQVVYFKLKEIWPQLSPAKAKKPGSFFTSLPLKQMKIWKYETKSQSKGQEVSSQWQLLNWGTSYIYIYTLYSKL